MYMGHFSARNKEFMFEIDLFWHFSFTKLQDVNGAQLIGQKHSSSFQQR